MFTSAKQAINDKLHGSVATYLRCGGVVNQISKGLSVSLSVTPLSWPTLQTYSTLLSQQNICQLITSCCSNGSKSPHHRVWRPCCMLLVASGRHKDWTHPLPPNGCRLGYSTTCPPKVPFPVGGSGLPLIHRESEKRNQFSFVCIIF